MPYNYFLNVLRELRGIRSGYRLIQLNQKSLSYIDLSSHNKIADKVLKSKTTSQLHEN